MRSRDFEKEGDATHVLLFSEAQPRQERGQARGSTEGARSQDEARHF
jgi:hypothetical protein